MRHRESNPLKKIGWTMERVENAAPKADSIRSARPTGKPDRVESTPRVKQAPRCLALRGECPRRLQQTAETIPVLASAPGELARRVLCPHLSPARFFRQRDQSRPPNNSSPSTTPSKAFLSSSPKHGTYRLWSSSRAAVRRR